MQITEQEYHKRSELNASKLSSFYAGPDYALMEVVPRPAWDFGHIFETYVQAQAEGSMVFDDKYFVGKGLHGAIPQDLLTAINDGTDLSTLYVYTKKGELSLTKKRLHSWLDAQLSSIGKTPVSQDDFDRAQRMTDNLFKTPFRGQKIRDFLERSRWQVPFFWTGQGVKKRGLADILIEENGEVELLADLKSTASIGEFYKAAKGRLWIQDLHYTEGSTECFGPVGHMTFVPVINVEPWVAIEPLRLKYKDQFAKGEDARLLMQQKYENLCENYRYWEIAGKKPQGYINAGEISVWV